MASYAADIEKALAELTGSGAVGPIPQPRPIVYESPTYKQVIDISKVAGYTPSSFAPLVEPKSLNLLSSIGNVLTGISGIGTNQFYHWTDKKLDWRDIPLADTISDFWRGVTKPLEDGFQWKDLLSFTTPAVIWRGLEEVGRDTKTTRDIMNNLGWLTEAPKDPDKGWNFFERRAGNLDYADVLSFIGDVILDPLTYVTFGAGSALKAGVRGATKEAADQLAKAGIKASIPKSIRNNVDELAQFVGEKIGVKLGKEAGEAARVAVENAAKSARFAAQNAAISLDIPFTNVTKTLIKKPEGSFFWISDPQIGEAGATAVRRILGDLGLDADQQAQFLKRSYGVSDPAKMTTQMLEHLKQTVSKVPTEGLKPVLRTPELIPQFAPALDDITRQLDTVLRSGGTYDDVIDLVQVGTRMRELPAELRLQRLSPEEILQNLEKTFNIYRFAQDMGGVSRASNLLGNRIFRYINPRTAGSTDQFVNEAVARIRDAETQVRANLTKMGRDMRQLERLTNGLTPEEIRKIPYILEGKPPGGQTMEEFLANVSDKDKLMRAADFARQMLHDIGTREQQADVLKNLIENYFPHVLKKEIDPEKIRQILSDKTAQKYLGRDAVNVFAQSRKGPDSFAQWDEWISRLEWALRNTTDPEEAAKIQQKIEQLNDLFERDTVVALAKRYQEHVYSTAMSELYTDLRNRGLILTADDAKLMDMKYFNENYVRIDKELGKKLSIKEITENGGWIHKDLLKQLQRTAKIFTDEGVEGIWEGFRTFTNIWRGLVTTLIPSHHVNNLIGNLANNFLAGVSAVDYKRAANLIRKMRLGKLSEAEKRLIQEAYDRGVLSSGMLYDVADPFREARLAQKGVLGRIEKAVNDWRVSQFMREHLGDHVEDFTRLALYLSGKRRGLTSRQAGDLVRTYLFNYGERTPLDEMIRNPLIPFWNWTKNNLALQFREFLRQPRYYSTFRHIQAMTDDEDPQVRPDYMADYLRIPGTNRYINLALPLSDLTKVTQGPVDALQYLLSGLGPLPRIPIEVLFNREIYTLKPIDYEREYSGQFDPLAWIDYAVRQTGLPGRILSAVQSKDPIESLARIIFPLWPQTYDESRAIREELRKQR